MYSSAVPETQPLWSQACHRPGQGCWLASCPGKYPYPASWHSFPMDPWHGPTCYPAGGCRSRNQGPGAGKKAQLETIKGCEKPCVSYFLFTMFRLKSIEYLKFLSLSPIIRGLSLGVDTKSDALELRYKEEKYETPRFLAATSSSSSIFFKKALQG